MNEIISNLGDEANEGRNPAKTLAEMPSYEEHMRGETAETAEQAKERLEKRRQKYIDTYTSLAVQKLFSNSKSGEDIDRRIFRTLHKDIPEQHLDRSRHIVTSIVETEAEREWDGQVFPATYPNHISLGLAKLAYRVGCLTIAGSEKGVDTAARMDLKYDSEAHPPKAIHETMRIKGYNTDVPDAISIEDVDSKEARLIQVGAGVIRKALDKAVAKRVQKSTPEFDKK